MKVRDWSVSGGKVGERTFVEHIEVRVQGRLQRSLNLAGGAVRMLHAVFRLFAASQTKIGLHRANDVTYRDQFGRAAKPKATRPASRCAQVSGLSERVNNLRQVIARDIQCGGNLPDANTLAGVTRHVGQNQQAVLGETVELHGSPHLSSVSRQVFRCRRALALVVAMEKSVSRDCN
jgi:hypothetical protein